jgi:multidrug efflux pump subunit AcrA (membrane-fusion protein)
VNKSIPTLVGAIALVGTVACSPVVATPSSQTPALSVAAATATRGDIQQTLSFSGDVRAQNQITVLPKASGRVEALAVGLQGLAQAAMESARAPQSGGRP